MQKTLACILCQNYFLKLNLIYMKSSNTFFIRKHFKKILKIIKLKKSISTEIMVWCSIVLFSFRLAIWNRTSSKLPWPKINKLEDVLKLNEIFERSMKYPYSLRQFLFTYCQFLYLILPLGALCFIFFQHSFVSICM